MTILICFAVVWMPSGIHFCVDQDGGWRHPWISSDGFLTQLQFELQRNTFISSPRCVYSQHLLVLYCHSDGFIGCDSFKPVPQSDQLEILTVSCSEHRVAQPCILIIYQRLCEPRKYPVFLGKHQYEMEQLVLLINLCFYFYSYY